MQDLPPGTGPLSPDFAGIDPELMDRFVGELERARRVIGENVEAIRQTFAANGMSALSLGAIREVEQWIDERLPELRRRNQMARDMAWLPGWAPVGGLVGYPEKDLPPAAEARRLGDELAGRYKDIDPDPFLDFAPGADEKYQAIIDELAARSLDPEFTASFFGRLGAARTLELPARLRKWLPQGQVAGIEAVSRAFGSAVSGGMAVGAFAAIATAVRDRTDDFDQRAAVGDLLSAGRFPTEWLARTVADQVLLPRRGGTASGEGLTPFLNALAADPAAARLALRLACTDSPLPKRPDLRPPLSDGAEAVDRRPDLAGLLAELNDRAAVDAGSADAFGRLLASASGVYDEGDGAHSDLAARFAFTVITTADDMRPAPATRIHLAEVAGSYASEITAGADFGDADHLMPSAFTAAGTGVPGLTAMFRLSPRDTYRFIETFAATDADLAPFHAAMGDLTRRLVAHGVPAMRAGGDPTRLDGAFAALGNVAGLELAAAETLRKQADDAAEAAAKSASFGTGTMLTLVGLGIEQEALAMLWDGLSTGWSGWDTYKSDPPHQVDRLHAIDAQQTLGRQHAIAQSLLDAGFPAEVSPADFQIAHRSDIPIADNNGELRPFADIAKSGSAGLAALDGWLIANGMGGDNDLSLGQVSSRLADRFNGQKSTAVPRVRLFGK